MSHLDSDLESEVVFRQDNVQYRAPARSSPGTGPESGLDSGMEAGRRRRSTSSPVMLSPYSGVPPDHGGLMRQTSLDLSRDGAIDAPHPQRRRHSIESPADIVRRVFNGDRVPRTLSKEEYEREMKLLAQADKSSASRGSSASRPVMPRMGAAMIGSSLGADSGLPQSRTGGPSRLTLLRRDSTPGGPDQHAQGLAPTPAEWTLPPPLGMGSRHSTPVFHAPSPPTLPPGMAFGATQTVDSGTEYENVTPPTEVSARRSRSGSRGSSTLYRRGRDDEFLDRTQPSPTGSGQPFSARVLQSRGDSVSDSGTQRLGTTTTMGPGNQFIGNSAVGLGRAEEVEQPGPYFVPAPGYNPEIDREVHSRLSGRLSREGSFRRSSPSPWRTVGSDSSPERGPERMSSAATRSQAGAPGHRHAASPINPPDPVSRSRHLRQQAQHSGRSHERPTMQASASVGFESPQWPPYRDFLPPRTVSGPRPSHSPMMRQPGVIIEESEDEEFSDPSPIVSPWNTRVSPETNGRHNMYYAPILETDEEPAAQVRDPRMPGNSSYTPGYMPGLDTEDDLSPDGGARVRTRLLPSPVTPPVGGMLHSGVRPRRRRSRATSLATSDSGSATGSRRSHRRRNRRRRRQKEAMKFSGKGEVKDYLLYFELLADYNGWDNHTAGLELATSLTDDAREVLSSLPPGMISDYLSLQHALLSRFSPDGREASFTVRLWNRVCNRGESVAAFGHAVRKLAKEAYPGIALHEQILIDIFVKGLPTREMRRHVHLARPTTLDAAIVLATTFEAFDQPTDADKQKKPKNDGTNAVVESDKPKGKKKSKSGKEGANVVGGGDSATGGSPASADAKLLELLQAMGNRLTKLEERLKPRSDRPRRDPSNVECFKCGKKGHYANECPERSPPKGNGGQGGSSSLN